MPRWREGASNGNVLTDLTAGSQPPRGLRQFEQLGQGEPNTRQSRCRTKGSHYAQRGAAYRRGVLSDFL